MKLSDAGRERPVRLAERKRRLSLYLMREAVLDLIREGEVAWADYMKSGAHSTLDDITDWNQNAAAALPPWRRS